jgi:uncharacterized protein (TIGR03435 family)
LFAAAAAICCRLLRRNNARVRYWIWLAASLKFAVPFALLVPLGTSWQRPAASTVRAPLVSALRVEEVTRSFAPVPASMRTGPAVRPGWWPGVPAAIWLAGVLLIAGRWGRRWAVLNKLRRAATEVALDFPIPVLATPAAIEPGVFGIVRPVLLLPEGLMDRLDGQQLASILAHELCHVRSLDNLTGALHMSIAALFWFHPAVWWIGRRLIEERERACDEAVLVEGSRPEIYAQGIVSVCRFYAASALPCASGVTGADLKKRIREIMTSRASLRMTFARKLMLAGTCAAAAALPVAIGFLRAQTLPPAPAYTYDVVSVHKADPKEMSSRLGPGPRGGMSAVNVTAFSLMMFAYDVRESQFIDVPGWVKSERFDVSFTPDKPEPGIQPQHFRELQSTFNRHRQRMQAVLRDRFGLVLRSETRELPLYALVVAKGGSKLRVPDDANAGPNMRANRGEITGQSAYLKMLTDTLSMFLGRFVANETGLDGPYDFKLQWTPDPSQLTGKAAVPDAPPATDEDQTSIFTALTEQLGLRLESRKGPVPVFVVEKVERPGEN